MSERTTYHVIRVDMENISHHSPNTSYSFETLLTPNGWRKNARLEVDARGRVTALELDVHRQRADIHIPGAACPGIPNLHSHSFQRAIAGLTSTRRRGSEDHFWTWRTEMYKAALLLSPEDVAAIAAQCFLEMIYSGYTSVAEFHYLHRAPNGEPYEQLSELSEAVIQASLKVGLPITHLPVLYRWSGVGSSPLLEEQRRFALTLDEYALLIEQLDDRYRDEPRVKVGIAPHSLRAVSPYELSVITDPYFAPHRHQDVRPVHIHIAEQMAEVHMWREHTGQRPIEWLLDQCEVDQRWCLVHSTHVSDEEMSKLANSGVTVGLCPSTEADLGDGIFPLVDYLELGGEYGIGSDSNLRINPAEELRLLEWGQRLHHQQRNLAFSKRVTSQIQGESSDHIYDSLGQSLMLTAARGGGRAVARETGFKLGCWADWFTLDPKDVGLYAAHDHRWSDQWVFAQRRMGVNDVYIGGSRVIYEGRHPLEEEINRDYRAAITRLHERS